MNKAVVFLFSVLMMTVIASSTLAADQVWNDADADNAWNLVNTNWDSGSTWTNGNNAIFSGTGETIELAADIVVSNLTFNSNNYAITNADSIGTFSIAGNPTTITVATNITSQLSIVVAGSGGIDKEGPGVLELNNNNTYGGVTHLKEGIIKLGHDIPNSLGLTGTGNELIIEPGAALDVNSAYSGTRAQHITVSGTGVNGSGAIFNSCTTDINYNTGFGNLTLSGDTTISTDTRWDLPGGYNVYGNNFTLTKIGVKEIAVSRPILNCPIIIDEGVLTMQHSQALGGTDYDTWVNDARLYAWGNITTAEHIYFTGDCYLYQGSDGQTGTFTGHLTVSNSLSLFSRLETNGLDIPAYIDGPGGITKTGPGWCYITCDTNSYAGTTQVNSSRQLWVGKPDGSSATGRLGPGPVIVNGSLYFDVPNITTITNSVTGGGTLRQRYDNELILSGSTSSSSLTWTICDGSLLLTNNASLNIGDKDFSMSDRQEEDYPVDPSNTLARLTITDGCSLSAKAFICGNGISYSETSMTSIVNQVGGTITSTGATAEDNGFRMGHYPGARTTWNMSGGTMICQNNYDICMATDGNGWFNVTGGDIYTGCIMLNERENSGGYGSFVFSGGTLHLGSATMAEPTHNAITTDSFPASTYYVEMGGLGAEVIAETDIYITVNTTLAGTGDNAVTFNSNGNTIYFSGLLSGTGGFNVNGGGSMEISTAGNTCSGQVNIEEGSTLVLSADDALPGATIYVEAGSILDCGGFSQTTAGIYGPGAVINRPGTVIILY